MLSMLVYKMGNKAVKNETMVAFFSNDNMSYEVIFNFLLILVFNLSIQLGYFTHVICVSFNLNMPNYVLFLEWKPCPHSYSSLPVPI